MHSKTLHLQGKAGVESLSRAVYFPFHSNKVKDKQEKKVTHTYALRDAKFFIEARK